MARKEPKAQEYTWSIIKLIWTASIVIASTGAGALIGWESHGTIGAVALGLVGLVIGVLLSSPMLLLQMIS